MTPAVCSPARERAAVAALFFLNGFGFANWATRIPQVQRDLGIGEAALGIALLALSAGSLVSMPVIGGLMDRHGAAAVTRGTSVAFCLALALPALAPSYLLLLAAAALFGACIGAMDVAMNAQASHNEKRLGRPVMASFHGVYSVGGLTGAAAGGGAASAGLSPGAHLLLAALLLAAGIALAWRSLHGAERTPGNGAPRIALPNRELAPVAAIAFCVLLGEGAIADWSAVYLAKGLQVPAGQAAAGFAAFSLMMAAGRFAGDRIIGRFGMRAVVRGGGTLAALGLGLGLSAGHVWTAVAGFALAGAGFACVFPCLVSTAARARMLSPGPAIAAVATAGYTGFLLGPPVIGFVSEASSLRVGLGVIAAASVLVAVLAARLPR